MTPQTNSSLSFDINQATHRYVLGFAFSPDLTRLALIRKEKPLWQAGKLNGIGGKIEDSDASPADAMAREFSEETGCYIWAFKWVEFAVLHGRKEAMPGALGQGESWAVRCFCVADVKADCVQTKTAETVVLLRTDGCGEWTAYDIVANLVWLIPMAKLRLQNKFKFHSVIKEE